MALGDLNDQARAWRRAVTEIGLRVAALREGRDSPLRVNVVFYVEGKQARNDFVGVRTGRFSRADKHLLVQAAVPSEPVESPRAAACALLMDAVNEAETFAQERGIARSLDVVREIATRATGD